MKARLKHTNRIIDVNPVDTGWEWNSQEGKIVFNEDQIEFLDDIYNDFRMDTAVKILCSMLTGSYDSRTIHSTAALAVQYTDALIDELIKENKDEN